MLTSITRWHWRDILKGGYSDAAATSATRHSSNQRGRFLSHQSHVYLNIWKDVSTLSSCIQCTQFVPDSSDRTLNSACASLHCYHYITDLSKWCSLVPPDCTVSIVCLVDLSSCCFSCTGPQDFKPSKLYMISTMRLLHLSQTLEVCNSAHFIKCISLACWASRQQERQSTVSTVATFDILIQSKRVIATWLLHKSILWRSMLDWLNWSCQPGWLNKPLLQRCGDICNISFLWLGSIHVHSWHSTLYMYQENFARIVTSYVGTHRLHSAPQLTTNWKYAAGLLLCNIIGHDRVDPLPCNSALTWKAMRPCILQSESSITLECICWASVK